MTQSDNYTVVVEGYDWGPGVSKIILHLDEMVTGVREESFTVQVTKTYTAIDFIERTAEKKTDTKEIKVIRQYLSDNKGQEVEANASNITLELDVHPSNVFTSPYDYDFESGLNSEVPLIYEIKQINALETRSGDKLENLTFTRKNQQAYFKPEFEYFQKGTHSYEDKEFGAIDIPYGFFTPENISDDRPLLVLLHGAGEGGTNPEIPLLGNKGIALAQEPIQTYFDGAYVLAPQAKTMWMDNGKGDYTKDGQSKYTQAVLTLIESFIENHAVDSKRVYLIGGSNGGYMTVNLLLARKELFAAGVPICEAYASKWIDENQLEKLKDVPLWFVHAKNDPVVLYEKTAEALVKRLEKIGHSNIHLTAFPDVVDTSGKYMNEEGQPYEYNGHWSWIPVFNDEVETEQYSLFEWLNEQSK